MEHYGNDSLCEIEHLFYGVDEVEYFFDEECYVGGGKLIRIKNDKDKACFANDKIHTLSKEHFEEFRTLFEFIISV